MKVIVAGSRNFEDKGILKMELDNFFHNNKVTEIVSGGARGADKLGEVYAETHRIPLKIFPADWSVGKQAGYLRNKKMAQYADALVAFWDGKSKGTKHMIDLANEYGLLVKVVNV